MEQHMLERAIGRRVTLDERVIDGHTHCRFLVHLKQGQGVDNEEQLVSNS
jgi:pyruvate/2-oxoglutarate dehydrogenase complex dihydrolipoamide acyltransferase (E2) component